MKLRKGLAMLLSVLLLITTIQIAGITASAATSYNLVSNISSIKLQGRAFQVGSKFTTSTQTQANNSICLPWGGDGIEFTAVVSAAGPLTVTVVTGGSSYGAQFNAVVDGAMQAEQTLVTGSSKTSAKGFYGGTGTTSTVFSSEQTLTLASSLSTGTHKIRIVRQDGESAAANTYLKSVSFSGSLGAKPGNSSLKIECVGDSITAGHGVLGGDSGTTDTGSGSIWNSDITKAWSYLTAKGLNADYSIVATSGISCTNTVKNNSYKQISPSVNTAAYSPAVKANVVVVNLHTNWDGIYGQQTQEERGQIFYDNAVTLVGQIRAAQGSAVKVVWIYNMMGCIEEQENRVKSLKTNGIVDGVLKMTKNQNGGNGHPDVSGQSTASTELLNYLKNTFGFTAGGTGGSTTASTASTSSTTVNPNTSSTTKTTTTTKSGSQITGGKVIDWDVDYPSKFTVVSGLTVDTTTADCSKFSANSTMKQLMSTKVDLSTISGIEFTINANTDNTAKFKIQLKGTNSSYDMPMTTLAAGANTFKLDFTTLGYIPETAVNINFIFRGTATSDTVVTSLTISDLTSYGAGGSTTASTASTSSTTVKPNTSSTTTTTTTKPGSTSTTQPSVSAGTVIDWDVNGSSKYPAYNLNAIGANLTSTPGKVIFDKTGAALASLESYQIDMTSFANIKGVKFTIKANSGNTALFRAGVKSSSNTEYKNPASLVAVPTTETTYTIDFAALGYTPDATSRVFFLFRQWDSSAASDVKIELSDVTYYTNSVPVSSTTTTTTTKTTVSTATTKTTTTTSTSASTATTKTTATTATQPSSGNPGTIGSYSVRWNKGLSSLAVEAGGARATSGSGYIKLGQVGLTVNNFANLIEAAKAGDGYIYINISGTFSTGSTAKFQMKGSLGGYSFNTNDSWDYSLTSGSSYTLKLPVASMTASNTAFDMNMMNYTYGNGIADMDVLIGNPYASGVVSTSSTSSTTSTTTKTTTTTTTTKSNPTSSSSTTQTNPSVLCGDVNCDGKVNGKDSLSLRMFNAGLNPTPFNEAAADTNGDGKINGKDSLTLKKYNAQIITALPCAD